MPEHIIEIKNASPEPKEYRDWLKAKGYKHQFDHAIHTGHNNPCCRVTFEDPNHAMEYRLVYGGEYFASMNDYMEASDLFYEYNIGCRRDCIDLIKYAEQQRLPIYYDEQVIIILQSYDEMVKVCEKYDEIETSPIAIP